MNRFERIAVIRGAIEPSRKLQSIEASLVKKQMSKEDGEPILLHVIGGLGFVALSRGGPVSFISPSWLVAGPGEEFAK